MAGQIGSDQPEMLAPRQAVGLEIEADAALDCAAFGLAGLGDEVDDRARRVVRDKGAFCAGCDKENFARAATALTDC